MNQQELMSILLRNEDELLLALSTSVRGLKFGKEEFEYFTSDVELYATIRFLYESLEEIETKEWDEFKCFYKDLNPNVSLNDISFKSLKQTLLEHIKVLINILANIQKAEESVSQNKIKSKYISMRSCDDEKET